jgi:hypothetical protein
MDRDTVNDQTVESFLSNVKNFNKAPVSVQEKIRERLSGQLGIYDNPYHIGFTYQRLELISQNDTHYEYTDKLEKQLTEGNLDKEQIAGMKQFFRPFTRLVVEDPNAIKTSGQREDRRSELNFFFENCVRNSREEANQVSFEIDNNKQFKSLGYFKRYLFYEPRADEHVSTAG